MLRLFLGVVESGPFIPPIHNLLHPLEGLGYQFTSGVAGLFNEWLTTIVGIGSAIAVYLRHHNCHEHGCWWLGWHPDKDGHIVCRIHSKDHPATGLFRSDKTHPRHKRNKT